MNDTVVLPSGAAASEVLTGIEWSIFPNNIIATYSEAGVYVEWRNEFKGRLSLDASSGETAVRFDIRCDSSGTLTTSLFSRQPDDFQSSTE